MLEKEAALSLINIYGNLKKFSYVIKNVNHNQSEKCNCILLLETKRKSFSQSVNNEYPTTIKKDNECYLPANN